MRVTQIQLKNQTHTGKSFVKEATFFNDDNEFRQSLAISYDSDFKVSDDDQDEVIEEP